MRKVRGSIPLGSTERKGSMETVIMILALLFSPGRYCKATVFGYPGDRMSGGPNRCTGKRMGGAERGVAHRRLPCGTKVLIVNPRNGRSTTATVVDRGPYGAMSDGGWVLKRTTQDPGTWRGCLDMSAAAAEDIGLNGFEKVFYVPVVSR